MNTVLISSYTLDELKTVISESVQAELSKFNTQEPALQPEFITRNEAINILGVSLPTLNNWTKSGLIQGYRIGSRVRYNKAELFSSLHEIQSSKFQKRN